MSRLRLRRRKPPPPPIAQLLELFVVLRILARGYAAYQAYRRALRIVRIVAMTVVTVGGILIARRLRGARRTTG